MIIEMLFRLTPRILDFIQEHLDENCALTLHNLIDKVSDEFQVLVCAATMHRAIGRFRYSLKIIQNIAIAADSPVNEALRLDFARWYLKVALTGRKIIFIDEVGFQLNMRVSQGRSPIGIRAENRVPAIRTRKMNVMAAIHDTGMTLFSILQANSNVRECAHFIDDLAAARDRLQIPADAIIVLDNLRFHHNAVVIEMLELRGFEYKLLPPYSPFFNGIESMLSEWKHFVTVGLQAHRARYEVDLEERINAFELAPEHATAYYHHIRNNCSAFIEGVRVFDN